MVPAPATSVLCNAAVPLTAVLYGTDGPVVQVVRDNRVETRSVSVGVIGGVQAGYNFQAGHFLFGVEGDFAGASFSHPVLSTPTLGYVDQHWIGTVAGRVGLVNDRWLVFAKLGGGWVHSNATLNFPGTVWNGSSTSSGWLVGGGIEYGFKPHWTVKLEYDYLGLSSWNSPTVPSVALNRDLQMVKAGINYKFESGVSTAAEPSAAGGSHEPSEDLQKASQNPIADLVSVPFQSNTNFNAGPFSRTQEVFNIQPVVPMHLSDDWNLISRTIIPLVSQPSPFFDSNTNGIGDITQSLFFLQRTRANSSGALAQSSPFRPPTILFSGPANSCSAQRPFF